jgi:hypothetical protein
MRVVVTKEFVGVPDGAVYGRPIQVGEELTGALAQLALREKWAKEKKADVKPEGEAEA